MGARQGAGGGSGGRVRGQGALGGAGGGAGVACSMRSHTRDRSYELIAWGQIGPGLIGPVSQVLVFADSFEHWVEHTREEDRYVLYMSMWHLDFVPPEAFDWSGDPWRYQGDAALPILG